MSYFASPWVLLPPSWNECHFFKTNFSKLLFPNACLPTEVVKFIFTTHYISFFTCNPITILATKVDYVPSLPWPLISLVSTFSNFHEKLKTKLIWDWGTTLLNFFGGKSNLSPFSVGSFSKVFYYWCGSVVDDGMVVPICRGENVSSDCISPTPASSSTKGEWPSFMYSMYHG